MLAEILYFEPVCTKIVNCYMLLCNVNIPFLHQIVLKVLEFADKRNNYYYDFDNMNKLHID